MAGLNELKSIDGAPNCSGDPERCERCAVRPLTICAALATDQLNLLTRVMTHRRHGAGESVFDEGDVADSVFNVTHGAIKTYKLLPDGRR